MEIPKAEGARSFQRKFDNFSEQRNWAIDNIQFKYPWVFHLDADERFTGELREECEKVIAEDKFSGFYVPFKMIFMGRWLKHGGMYPGYQMRLMKIGEVRFAQKGHGQQEAEAKRGIGYLKSPLLHYNFSKGIADWLEKHNRYSTEEAKEAMNHIVNGKFDLAGLVSNDGLRRRRALKELSYRLPFRPTLRFIYMYFLRLGFLDGWEGLTYCRLMKMYEYMIVLKMKEIERREKGLPI
jgi:hypothetical protein